MTLHNDLDYTDDNHRYPQQRVESIIFRFILSKSLKYHQRDVHENIKNLKHNASVSNSFRDLPTVLPRHSLESFMAEHQSTTKDHANYA